MFSRRQRGRASTPDLAQESNTQSTPSGRGVQDAGGDGAADPHGQSRLLSNLASQRSLEVLSRFDHPAGKIPSPGVLRGAFRPAKDQYSPTREKDRVDPDDDPEPRAHLSADGRPAFKLIAGRDGTPPIRRSAERESRGSGWQAFRLTRPRASRHEGTGQPAELPGDLMPLDHDLPEDVRCRDELAVAEAQDEDLTDRQLVR